MESLIIKFENDHNPFTTKAALDKAEAANKRISVIEAALSQS